MSTDGACHGNPRCKARVIIRIYGAGSTLRRRGIKSPGVRVRGHAGHPENELADALASRGIDELED
jgi:ribonuclease HI